MSRDVLTDDLGGTSRRFRVAALFAAGLGYAGALAALVPVLEGPRAFAGLALAVLGPAPMAIDPFRMRRFLGFDPPPRGVLSALMILGVVLASIDAPPLVILPLSLCAMQGHLLAALHDDRAAAWAPPIAVLQVLSALALVPTVVVAALVPVVLTAAVAAQLLLLARITRRAVSARALGAAAMAEDDAGAFRRVAYAVPLAGVLLLFSLIASPLASTPPWRLADAAGIGPDGQRREPPENALADEEETGGGSMGFSSDIATNGIPMPAYEILMEIVPRDEHGDLGDIGPIHLRGIVLSQFTKRGVRMRGTHQPTRYRDGDDGYLDGAVRFDEPEPGQSIQYWLSHYPLPIDPQGWNLLFTVEPFYSVDMEEVRYDPDRLLVGTEVPEDWFTYVIEAGRPDALLGRVGRRPARHDSDRFVTLPPATAELTKIIEEGRRVTDGATSDLDRVHRLVKHFRSSFEYSIEDTEFAGTEGLGEFLDRRSGFCTQFASASVLMLRAQGVPARVVTGFLASEFNAGVGAYQVRPRDTHAWFEVHFEGVGWVGFDSTPEDRRRAAIGAAGDDEPDALEWAGALMDRIGALATTPEAGVTPRDVLQTLRDAPASVRRAVLVGLAIVLVLAIALRLAGSLSGRRTSRTKAQREVEGIYGRLLVLLAKRGYRKLPASTPREFAYTVIHRGGTSYRPLARITEDLYAVRYGERPLDGKAKARIEEFAATLKAAPVT